jgi:hypothetical protein
MGSKETGEYTFNPSCPCPYFEGCIVQVPDKKIIPIIMWVYSESPKILVKN